MAFLVHFGAKPHIQNQFSTVLRRNDVGTYTTTTTTTTKERTLIAERN